MTFQEFWIEVEKTKVLPNTAICHIPNSLSEKLKKKLIKIEQVEAAKILLESIDQINHCSVESIESLINKKFK